MAFAASVISGRGSFPGFRVSGFRASGSTRSWTFSRALYATS
ncbi:hypothetical protein HTIA_1784 [Halorhabdus tiamatea SARL4B]|uniref:Uncharacterized protein n=1 Tax=Halorhabdus tiamatea SARL4B TaxID=1033806 RepID=S6D151_9EURY|nr:hypothetical protein HTIA_1784 [Halorhabdus tiamatea SARL4B]